MRRDELRWGRLGATLVVVVCAVTVGCAVTDPAEPRPAADHRWNQSHRIDLLAGWTVTARNVGREDESSSLAGPSDSGCLVSAWPARPERFVWPRSPRDVEVQGKPGHYGTLDPDYGPYPRAVVWQDAPNRWFRVSCDLDRAGILAVAEGVHAADHPMRLPFTLSAIPDGLTLTQLIESNRDGRTTASVLFEVPSAGRPQVMEVSNLRDDVLLQGPVERRTIAGHEVEVRTATQSICFPTRSERVCVSGPGDEPATDWSESARAVAFRTAGLITPVDDPSDETSWLDADDALPS